MRTWKWPKITVSGSFPGHKNDRLPIQLFKILMDECIASPELESTSLPLAQINLEKMFTYMQIQKSSSNSINYHIMGGFRQN